MNSTPDKPFEMTSGDARIHMREALDQVRKGVPVHITRYGRREAVMVPPGWFDKAHALMAAAGHAE